MSGLNAAVGPVAVVAALLAGAAVVLLCAGLGKLSSLLGAARDAAGGTDAKVDALGAQLADTQRELGVLRERLDLLNTVLSEKADGMVAESARGVSVVSDSVARLDGRFASFQQQVTEQVKANGIATNESLSRGFDSVNSLLKTNSDTISSKLAQTSQSITAALKVNTDTHATGNEQMSRSMREMRGEVEAQLKSLRAENSQKLEEMRGTVDEKLQKTLDERMTSSFSQVNKQLEQVYRGLGEMRGVAENVGDLKKVLSNVKSRGILGEIQLGAILSEVLTPQQYETNFATVPGSSERVEYAVKMPSDGNPVYLPIDSKFPADAYTQYRDAIDEGDGARIAEAWKTLESRIKSEAKDISSKYVAPPYTTNFAIMFLPFEGLYAEIVGHQGLVESLQHLYRVNVCGPSTMAALLNSLQMGFQTVAIQRNADQIRQVLSAVKTEFATYQGMVEKARKQLSTASKTMDTLATTRMRAMDRKLSSVTELADATEAAEVIGVEAYQLDEGDAD
jgi:DNA recombination protein RmuC